MEAQTAQHKLSNKTSVGINMADQANLREEDISVSTYLVFQQLEIFMVQVIILAVEYLDLLLMQHVNYEINSVTGKTTFGT